MGARTKPTEAGLYGTTISCGVRELRGVSWTEPLALIKGLNLRNLAHVVFSDRLTNGGPFGNSGAKFAAFITANHLGEVHRTASRVNPNSRNPIAVWTWTPNKAAVQKLLKASK